MGATREERYPVDFPVFLSWQAGKEFHRVSGRCIELSVSGAALETMERVDRGITVLVESKQFGRMGLASVRHCSRATIKYRIGLHFGTALHLSDPGRRKTLEGVLKTPVFEPAEPRKATSEAERPILAKQLV